MRNKRLFFVLTGAVVFGLVAAVSVSRYLSNAQANTKDLNYVVIAKVDIPPGTKVVAEQLTAVQFPRNATPDGAFDKPEKLIGRVSVMNIAAREPITDFKLAPEGSAGGLSAVIPEGYRAMTVKVDDVVGVSGFLQPNTLVDIVVVINPPDKAFNRDPISKIVLQNIKVLASGQNIDRPKNEREVETVKAVTLQVTPEQAEKLALASSEGRLQLVMRNSTDQGDEQTPGANKQSLLSGERATFLPEPGSLKSEQPKAMPASSGPVMVRTRVRVEPRVESPRNTAAPQPTPAPTPRASVEMIEGGKRRNVDFP